ncbi:MAG TPA: HAMP domain-containing sensor histidine kinase, partial [Mycobacteriales bacterium]|nr:HAMP domain-containing sensor histidine kinase [Mycobacteriales bacterium]
TDATRAIRESGAQLLTLVNDILEVARAEAGRLELDIQPVDPRAALTEIEPTLRGLAGARDISLTVRMPRSLPKVATDPRRLREVVLNLVDNAVKYTAAGGSVSVEARSVAGAVEVTVTDTGVGIPDEVGDRIFEPFYRVHGTRTQHGEPSTGLGLALSHRLVAALGGDLRYESAESGTTFRMTLPVAAPSPSAQRAQRAPVAAASRR